MPNTPNQKVAIIVPIYNVAPYLKQCLDSILSQTHGDFYAVLVNDGSTDNGQSLEIALSYVRRDSRFVLLDKENGGQGSARNAGIALVSNEFSFSKCELSQDSSGGGEQYKNLYSFKDKATTLYCQQSESYIPSVKYLIFLDSDDWWEAECLSTCIAHAEGVEVVWFDYQFYYDGIAAPPHPLPTPLEANRITRPTTLTRAEWIARDVSLALAANALLDFDFIRACNLSFLPRAKHEDGLFALSVLLCATRICFLPSKPYFYRLRGDSVTNRRGGASSYPFIRDIFSAMNNDTSKALGYWGASSYFRMFIESLRHYEEERDPATKDYITRHFLHPFGVAGAHIAHFDKDPLDLQPSLPLLAPFIKPSEIKIFAKLGIFAPRLYRATRFIRAIYHFGNALERRFRHYRNKLFPSMRKA